jgi:hypothetical protein
VRERIGVATIVEMTVEFRLSWVGHVWGRFVDFVVMRLDKMEDYPIARGSVEETKKKL